MTDQEYERNCDPGSENCQAYRAEIARLKEESQKDYDGMRQMQAKFIEADQKCRALVAENSRLRTGLAGCYVFEHHDDDGRIEMYCEHCGAAADDEAMIPHAPYCELSTLTNGGEGNG